MYINLFINQKVQKVPGVGEADQVGEMIKLARHTRLNSVNTVFGLVCDEQNGGGLITQNVMV